MGLWVFPHLRGDDVRRDPNETELFRTEQTGESEYAGTDALVREVLQNSLDAREGKERVLVRIGLHDANVAPPPSELAHYFARLESPLAARQIPFASGAPSLPCRFLVIEDFGTMGLEGDTSLFEDPPQNGSSPPQCFYWFWRNIGRSGKTGDDLGRWGLGKTVYRAVSRAGCMFGLTVRHSDRRRMLMGQAVLQIHRHQGREFKPEGYWCSGQDTRGLPLPIEDRVELDRFTSHWKLTRTAEPGLSVVCPFVPDELDGHRLLQAVAVHFFNRILRGDLEVEVKLANGDTVSLDAAGLADACERIPWDGPARTKRHIAPPIRFAKRCLSQRTIVATEVLGRTRVPSLDEDALPETTIHDLRRQFATGGLIALRVNVCLPRIDGRALEGHADVFVQRTEDGRRCDSYYVREGMTITKINAQAGRRGVQSLVLVDQGPLAELLGDSEGPAHEDWDQSAERPERFWQRGWKGRVRFVRRIVDSLVELLTPSSTEPDFDLLSDFFSIDRAREQQPARAAGNDVSSQSTSIQPPPASPKWYRISPRPGGFSVSRDFDLPIPENSLLSVAVAYDLPRGNPLRNWSPLDFSIGREAGALRAKGKGLRAQRIEGNVVRLRSFEDDFSFAVDGFDVHRDLYVRVDEIDDKGSHSNA